MKFQTQGFQGPQGPNSPPINTMTVSTFIPSYSQQQHTRTTTLPSGEAFNYRKLRIREDLFEALVELKPNSKTLTAYINSVLESYLADCR